MEREVPLRGHARRLERNAAPPGGASPLLFKIREERIPLRPLRPSVTLQVMRPIAANRAHERPYAQANRFPRCALLPSMSGPDFPETIRALNPRMFECYRVFSLSSSGGERLGE